MKDDENTVKYTSSHIKAIIRMRYTAPQYAVVEEVRNATGKVKRIAGARPRYADMLAIGLWPSVGLDIIGFEIKTTRADWLKEISDAKKAVAIQQYCDRWYLVVPHKNHERIVRSVDGVSELPPTWGMLTVDNGVVREIVKAPKLNAVAITRPFLASLMRNACTSNPDYMEVQSRIIENQHALATPIRSKSGIKTARKQVMSSQAAEIKRLKRVIADMQLAMSMDNNSQCDTTLSLVHP